MGCLTDSLYDEDCEMRSAKKLWEDLARKYKSDEVGTGGGLKWDIRVEFLRNESFGEMV